MEVSGITVTNRNEVNDEIRRRITSGNTYYYSVRNLLSSLLLSKTMKIRL
jgi:hypothetical protein